MQIFKHSSYLPHSILLLLLPTIVPCCTLLYICSPRSTILHLNCAKYEICWWVYIFAQILAFITSTNTHRHIFLHMCASVCCCLPLSIVAPSACPAPFSVTTPLHSVRPHFLLSWPALPAFWLLCWYFEKRNMCVWACVCSKMISV